MWGTLKKVEAFYCLCLRLLWFIEMFTHKNLPFRIEFKCILFHKPAFHQLINSWSENTTVSTWESILPYNNRNGRVLTWIITLKSLTLKSKSTENYWLISYNNGVQNGCNDWRLVSWRWEINVFFFKDVFASSVPIEFISDISYFQTSKLNVPAYFFFRERRNQRLLPETSIISRVCLALTASEVIKLDWYWTSDGNQRAWILFWFSILRRRSLILPKKK